METLIFNCAIRYYDYDYLLTYLVIRFLAQADGLIHYYISKDSDLSQKKST